MALPLASSASCSGTETNGNSCPPNVNANGGCPPGCTVVADSTVVGSSQTSTMELICTEADGCLLSISSLVPTADAETLAQPVEVDTSSTVALSVDGHTQQWRQWNHGPCELMFKVPQSWSNAPDYGRKFVRGTGWVSVRVQAWKAHVLRHNWRACRKRTLQELVSV